jgi:phage FluMu protein Com
MKMANWYYTKEMQGERPFKCYVCGKLLCVSVDGEYQLKLKCSRCKTDITLKTEKSLPNVLVIKHGELANL